MSGMGGSFSIVTGALRDGDGTQTVLGVHVVAPDASDLIAEAQQIVANHIPLHEAANAIHPHPTFSEMIGETLLKADGRPDASDLIAEAQQIVANHIPLHEAANAIHPHPTFSEMIGETLLKADGRPLHTR